MTATDLRPVAPANHPSAKTDRLRSAVAGVLAAGLALAAGEFLAALLPPRPGPVTAVANRVVDSAPGWFVSFGKDVFGLADKPALMVGTIITTLAIGAALGVIARRSLAIGSAGIAAFGVVGLFAIASDAQAGFGSALLIAAVSALSGIGALVWLLAQLQGPPNQTARRLPVGVTDSPTNPAVRRRSFLGAAGVVGVGVVAGGFGAREIRSRSTVEAARDAARDAVPTVAGGVQADVAAVAVTEVATTPGITPIVVANDEFYRIDTALIVPQVDPTNWRLTIKGMVEREVSYSFEDLLARATTVETVTLSCVSNEVGGDLVGNAVWQGVPLTELLEEAGVLPAATQIKSTSVDGWDCGFPTDVAYDGRTALVAVAMNDEPLPTQHGFPARLVVSGLYGYVSATKWLDSIELTTLEDFDGYWIPRGWSKLGPIKTQSRIDTPRPTKAVKPGPVPIAGVAWAPNTGIDSVEVRIDGGEWSQATLGQSLGASAWRQWVLNWEATPGTHRIECRATDASGTTQTEVRTQVAPDGASGWHTIQINVEG